MARFTGTGTFNIGGGDARVYDIDFANDGGVAVTGPLSMRDCEVTGDSVAVASGASDVYIRDNFIDPFGADAIQLLGNNDQVIIANNHLGVSADNGVYVTGSVHTEMVITDNIIKCDVHGVFLDGAGVDGLTISGNTMRPTTHGIYVFGGAIDGVIASNSIADAGGNGIYVDGATHDLVVNGNLLLEPAQHGLLIEADGVTVQANRVIGAGTAASATYDNIQVAGDRNRIFGNTLIPNDTVTRYGVNVASGDCNLVVGNDLGDPADYTSDAFNDAGTNTQITYPNDPTYGDNFTDCVTSS